MTDTNDIIQRVKSDDESDESIFAKAIESGDMSDINEAAKHLEMLQAKREQATEFALSGSKKSIDEKLEQARTDIDAAASRLSDSPKNDAAKERAAVLSGLADGANVSVSSLSSSSSTSDDTPGGISTVRQSDTLEPQEREKKIERLSVNCSEAESLGYTKAAESYRTKIRELRQG